MRSARESSLVMMCLPVEKGAESGLIEDPDGRRRQTRAGLGLLHSHGDCVRVYRTGSISVDRVRSILVSRSAKRTPFSEKKMFQHIKVPATGEKITVNK